MKKFLLFYSFIFVLLLCLLIFNNIPIKIYSCIVEFSLNSMFKSFSKTLLPDELKTISDKITHIENIDLYYSFSSSGIDPNDFKYYKRMGKKQKNALLASIIRLSLKSEKIVAPRNDFILFQTVSAKLEYNDILYIKTSEKSHTISIICNNSCFAFFVERGIEENPMSEIIKCFISNDYSFYSPELNNSINSLVDNKNFISINN